MAILALRPLVVDEDFYLLASGFTKRPESKAMRII
jgi:hypothetical protein